MLVTLTLDDEHGAAAVTRAVEELLGNGGGRMEVEVAPPTRSSTPEPTPTPTPPRATVPRPKPKPKGKRGPGRPPKKKPKPAVVSTRDPFEAPVQPIGTPKARRKLAEAAL